MTQQDSPRVGAQGRRSERVLLRIPIKVKGTSADGKPFTENCTTLVINRNGARITLKNSLRPDDSIAITNFYNDLTCPFRVVGRTGKSLGEGPEWGVECLEPEKNIWGISFPEKKGAPEEEDLIEALLECTKCASRELAQLTQKQFQGLSAQETIQRECPKCKTTTEWNFALLEEEAEQPVPLPPSRPPFPPAKVAADKMPSVTLQGGPAARTEERRRVKRVTLKLPVRVRLSGGGEEITKTENYSKLGACFLSALDLKEGESLFLTVGYAPGSMNIESPARVIWRRPIEGAKQAFIGVELESQPPKHK